VNGIPGGPLTRGGTFARRAARTVSIMEFSGDKVARETQYFADPFEASTWRAQWVERMGA
jgi:hypothetical protein